MNLGKKIWTANGNEYPYIASEEDNIFVTNITLNKSSLSLETGQEETLIPTVQPDNATDKTITWSSSDKNVADIDNSGKVTAIAAGTAVITCTANDGSGVMAECAVTVTNPNHPNPKLMLSASPSGGKVLAWTIVSLSAKANGNTVTDCDIYYTTNGTIPSKNNGTKYTSSGITIYPECTLKAIAYKTGYETSDVLTTSYAVELFLHASPSSGEVEKGTIVELYARDEDDNDMPADIYYTLDGSTPSKYSTPYTSSGITINSDCTLKAIAYNLDIVASDLLTASFTIKGDGDINGISIVPTDKKYAPVFSIFGQRLAAPRKGVNIVGRKKVVVK